MCDTGKKYGDWCAKAGYDDIVRTSEGKSYCIFHAPITDKDPNMLENAVFERIDKCRNDNKECDLRGTVFGEISFEGKSDKDNPFPEIDFSYSVFQLADFKGANFKSAVFIGANFKEAVFNGANFESAVFSGAIFKEAVFYRAIFKSAEFSGANFQESADFGEANFKEAAFFNGANFKEAYFRDANFHELARFYRANFKSARFRDANFQEADFIEANIMSADFRGANFQESADFSEANFKESAVFMRVNFHEWADFSEANFKDADFSEAIFLEKADFSEAIFKEAYFYGKTFIDSSGNPTKADFRNVKVEEFIRFINVDLRHALFSYTKIEKMEFYNVEWLEQDGRRAIYDEIIAQNDLLNAKTTYQDASGNSYERYVIDQGKPSCFIIKEGIKALFNPPGQNEYSLVGDIYNRLKQKYKNEHNDSEVSYWHWSEKEMQRRITSINKFPQWLLLNLYNFSSRYGESAGRAFWVLVFFLLIFSLALWDKGMEPNPYLYPVKHPEYIMKYETSSYLSQIGAVILDTSKLIILMRDTYLTPRTFTGEIIKVIAHFALPLQFGLLALAVRNRLRR